LLLLAVGEHPRHDRFPKIDAVSAGEESIGRDAAVVLILSGQVAKPGDLAISTEIHREVVRVGRRGLELEPRRVPQTVWITIDGLLRRRRAGVGERVTCTRVDVGNACIGRDGGGWSR
jgi:hypothetical protein